MAKTEIENTVPGLAGWETVELIGRGSFGAVYEIRKTVLGGTERCALKHISIPRDESEILELRLEGQDGESITRTFTRQAESIVSEYRLMAQLNNCPNVVSSYDVEAVQKEGGYGWDILIRMELLTPLKKYLVQQQDYPETEILRLGREIANALVACGRQRILHRDIKPENIMVAADGTYKLGDFGIARTAEKTGSATAQIGTYAYMAPEVYHGERYGALADQYSLGMVLYWLLNGRRAPFVTVNTAEEKENALRRRMSGEQIPEPLHGGPELKRIVLKCCAYDPRGRYRTAEELLRALETVEVGVSDDPQTMTDTDGLSRTPAPARETAISEEATVGVFGASAPVGATSGRPAVTPAPEPEDATVRAPIARGEDATVGVFGAAKAEKPAPVGADALGGPQKTEPSPEEDGTVSVFGAAKAEKPAPVGADVLGGPQKPEQSPDEEATVSVIQRNKPQTPKQEMVPEKAPARAKIPTQTQPKPEPQPKSGKKKNLLIVLGAMAVLVVLIFLLLSKGGATEKAQDSTISPTATQTVEPTSGQSPESVDKNAVAYAEAEALAASGKTYEAALAFYAIKDYRDSWDRCFELWGQVTQRETVAAELYHTVGVQADGTAVATGWNYCGECEVSGWRDVVAISARGVHNAFPPGYVRAHTVGLRSDGTVVATGDNYYGQCEVDGWTDIVAVSAGFGHTVGLRADGTVVAVGDNEYGQCEVSGWTDIVAISAGGWHTVGLRSDGTVVAVGISSSDGRCDVGDWTDIVAVSAGQWHTVGLRSDGTVLAVGYSWEGQCKVSDWTDIVAVSAGNSHTVGLRSDGTVVAVGFTSHGRCDVSDWTDIVAVSAQGEHTVGLRSDGTVVAAGNTSYNRRDVSGWRLALPEKKTR